MEQKPVQYLVSAELLQGVVNLLQQRPYVEVWQLIQAMQLLKPVPQDKKTPSEHE